VLGFHRVLRQLLEAVGILPFRFPTILSGDRELEAHMESASGRYKQLLEKYKTSVQMEVMVSGFEMSGAPATGSGREYLRSRKDQLEKRDRIVAGFESLAGSAVIEWRVRSLPRGVRCFARLERDSLDQFRAAMKTWKPPEGHIARVSGPWPVTEFFSWNRS
jgi:hypothetical protein